MTSASAPWNPLDDLTRAQRETLDAFSRELASVNRAFNLVADSTLASAQRTHLVHSLALARHSFPDGAVVVDFGTGGGLPAVPLAIRFPDVEVVAVDSVRKKVEAVRLFARRLGLVNLSVWNGRAEAWDGSAHYAVSRATAPISDLWRWFEGVRDPLRGVAREAWRPGLLTLKGGDLTDEIADLHAAAPDLAVRRYDLADWLGKAFQTKALLHVWHAVA